MRDFNLKNNLDRLFTPPSRNHFATLDGLRAISILWVLGFHLIFFISTSSLDLALTLRNDPLFAWLKFGFRGVDIFFVISGLGVVAAYLYNYTAAVAWLDAHAGWRRALLGPRSWC